MIPLQAAAGPLEFGWIPAIAIPGSNLLRRARQIDNPTHPAKSLNCHSVRLWESRPEATAVLN